jgi:hypothetical protein
VDCPHSETGKDEARKIAMRKHRVNGVLFMGVEMSKTYMGVPVL